MPTLLREKRITTLRSFTDTIESTLRIYGKPLWFRGSGKSSYPLKPSLYRHPTVIDISGLVNLESQLISRFKQRSIPYQSRPILTDWEYLFFMQHFGVPTRLLDWTENPYIALFFALTSAERKDDRGTLKYSSDVAVWILNPVQWNRRSLSYMHYTGEILSTDDTQISGYVPSIDHASMNSDPISMYGIHNSPRIVAQRGVFTIFGQNTNPMENIYTLGDYPQDSLIKIVIPKVKIAALLDSIISIGITDSVVFPDLDGLARETKRFFQFGV